MDFALTSLPLPLTLRPSTPMTEDELLQFCAKNDSLQIEREPNGDLIVMSPSGAGTGNLNSELNLELALWNRHEGAGYCFDSNAGFTLADGSVRSADAAWVSRSRWESLSADEQKRFAPICPEFVIELRSPSDSLPGLERKMEHWLSNGAALAWLIDPLERAVTIYQRGEGPVRHTNPTEVRGRGVVEAFTLPLARIFT